MKVSEIKLGEKYTSDTLIREHQEYLIVDSIRLSKDRAILKLDYYKIDSGIFSSSNTMAYIMEYSDEVLSTFYVYKESTKFPFEIGKTYKAISKNDFLTYKIVFKGTDSNRLYYAWIHPNGTSDDTSRTLENFYEHYTNIELYEDPSNSVKELKKELEKKDQTIKELQNLVYGCKKDLDKLSKDHYKDINNITKMFQDQRQKELEDTIQGLEINNYDRYNKIISLNKNIDGYKLDYYRISSEKESLQAKVDSLLVENDSYKRSYKELNDRLNSYKQANEDLRKNYNKLVTEHMALRILLNSTYGKGN